MGAARLRCRTSSPISSSRTITAFQHCSQLPQISGRTRIRTQMRSAITLKWDSRLQQCSKICKDMLVMDQVNVLDPQVDIRQENRHLQLRLSMTMKLFH